MIHLFTPYTLRSVTFRNRIAVSPMCQYSAIDGYANDWHLVHLGSRATGGAGLVIAEATAVSPEGRITPDDLGLWDDTRIAKLKEITHFIHSQGSIAGIQLAHAGRKASHQAPWKGGQQLSPTNGGWETLAPSAIPFKESDLAPIALDISAIAKLINDFALATKRALNAGFQVVEIHAAHGYLLHEFLSPLSNNRNDEYGGRFENRIRLLVEVTKAVRLNWPESLPLFVRISASDWAEGGWDIEESVKLAAVLKEMGVDLIDCSSGGAVVHQKIALGPGYQVAFSTRIRQETGIATGAVGLITTAPQAEEIIASGKADIVLIARESLRDPYFPLHAAKELGAEIKWPVQYERAK